MEEAFACQGDLLARVRVNSESVSNEEAEVVEKQLARRENAKTSINASDRERLTSSAIFPALVRSFLLLSPPVERNERPPSVVSGRP